MRCGVVKNSRYLLVRILAEMNKVQHLWNLINRLSSNPEVEAEGLQSYYVERCRRMESDVELPPRIFGPGAMCSYCGSLWSRVDHRVRLKSGKNAGKSVRKTMKKSGKKLGRFKESLIKKAAKNYGNKTIIRCSVCSKDTEIKLNKPARLKPKVEEVNDTPVVKKRKKRTKDKTAGLIIASDRRSFQDSSKTPAKVKATNLKKLGALVSRNLTPSKKSSLHEFISELG